MSAMRITTTAAVSGVLLLSLGLAGCSAGDAGGSAKGEDATPAAAATKTPEPAPNLTGKWEQSNKKSEDSYQAATIKGDTIVIDWVSDGGDTTSLYWAGSFEAPTEAGHYSWKSQNDTTKTANALLASSDKTKTFTYDNGEISYKVSALGTTTTVRLSHK
jgi:hypothetical protein